MATILKTQTSLYISALKWFSLALAIAIVGRLLLPVSVFITIASMFAFIIIMNKMSPFLTGAYGEWLVTNEIKKFGDNYFLINDFNFPGMQIDHVLICPKGIFTIETKTYFGSVYGNGDEKNWKLYIGGISRLIYSPIKQARGHSVKLYELLKKKGFSHRIDSIVVFAGLANVHVQSQPIPVLQCRQLHGYLTGRNDVLSKEQVLEYKGVIMSLLS